MEKKIPSFLAAPNSSCLSIASLFTRIPMEEILKAELRVGFHRIILLFNPLNPSSFKELQSS
jgi:hypothetical protein